MVRWGEKRFVFWLVLDDTSQNGVVVEAEKVERSGN